MKEDVEAEAKEDGTYGATVMVLMSTAAPSAMAAPAYFYDQQPDISGGSYSAEGIPNPCLLWPWVCLPPKDPKPPQAA